MVFFGVLVEDSRVGISCRGSIVGFSIDRGASALVIDYHKD